MQHVREELQQDFESGLYSDTNWEIAQQGAKVYLFILKLKFDELKNKESMQYMFRHPPVQFSKGNRNTELVMGWVSE